MSKSLSELMSSPDVGRPERDYPICVSGKLAAELADADAAYFEAEAAYEKARQEAEERSEGERPGLRLGEKSPLVELDKAASEAAAKSDAIRARMEEHTVTLHLRGKSSGEWRQWVSAHPARDDEEDRAGAKRDAQWAGSICNIDALIPDLGEYVAKYGDEDPTEGSWRFISENAAPGDLTMLASVVIGMHEQGIDLGKSRVAWRSARRSADDSK